MAASRRRPGDAVCGVHGRTVGGASHRGSRVTNERPTTAADRRSHPVETVQACAGLRRQQAVPAELGLGSADRECAPQVPREPDVQHLAPLPQPAPRRARSVGARLCHRAFARPTQTRCECQRVIGPPGLGPRSPRRTLNMTPTIVERPARHVRVDEGLRVPRVEPAGPAAVAALGVEVPHAAAAAALRGARDVARRRGGGGVAQAWVAARLCARRRRAAARSRPDASAGVGY